MTDAEHEARYAKLESAIAEMRVELERLQRPRIRSMRMTGRCPSCDGGRLLHVKRLKETVGDGTTVDFSLQKHAPSFWTMVGKPTGVLEAFACRECRLVEWNAVSLDDVKIDGKDVVELETTDAGSADSAPYR
jgi:hypothetical protein